MREGEGTVSLFDLHEHLFILGWRAMMMGNTQSPEEAAISAALEKVGKEVGLGVPGGALLSPSLTRPCGLRCRATVALAWALQKFPFVFPSPSRLSSPPPPLIPILQSSAAARPPTSTPTSVHWPCG